MIFNEMRRKIFKQFLNCRANSYLFASRNDKDSKPDNFNQDSIGNNRGIIYNMRKDANIARKQRQQSKQLHKYTKRVQDHLVQLTLYMQHNHWKSQFIYLLLNYNKLGFKMVSDYAFLDSSSYMLELRNLKEEERWPTVRAIIGLRPRIIVTGAEQIQKFFIENMYFTQSLLKDSPQTGFAKKYIDQQIVPHMQSLLWHPTLTYQTTFHTDTYYHQAEQKNYMLVEILWRNFGKCGKAVFSNILKIMKEKQRYLNSKDKLTKSLKQMAQLYLTKGQFFGGDNPNFIDFYLFSHLKTNWQSKYFKAYLQDEISPQFKRWVVRIGWNCEYSRDRVTVL